MSDEHTQDYKDARKIVIEASDSQNTLLAMIVQRLDRLIDSVKGASELIDRWMR